MQATNVQIIPAQALTTTLSSYYTSRAKTKTLLSKLTLTNVTGSAETVDVHLVPSGGTADATNRLIQSRTLDTNEAWSAYPIEGQVLREGDSIHAVAGSNDAILIMASGVELTG